MDTNENRFSSPIIHIGLPKAASTYVKRAYFRRMSSNIVIPRGKLIEPLASKDFAAKDYRSAVADVMSRSRGQSESPDDRLILSAENLSGGFWESADSAQIAENLYSAFPSGRVILIIREQLDYISSVYRFRITKGFKMPTFAEFLKANQTSLLTKLCYSKLIGVYVNHFGKDRVLVIPFEMLARDEPQFSRKLMSFCGLPLKYPEQEHRKNTSIKGFGALERVRRLNDLLYPLLALERACKRTIFREHYRLMQGAEHFTIQDYIIRIAQIGCARQNGNLCFSDEFLTAARNVFPESNAAVADLTSYNLRTLGYM